MAEQNAEQNDWAFPENLQPQAGQLGFDLLPRLRSVVRVHSEVPAAAFTAATLGTDRAGNGIAIHAQGRTVILTAGYLITEAENITLTLDDNRQIPGHALTYDQATGFGLVLPLGPLNLPTLELGDSHGLKAGQELIVVGFGGLRHTLTTQLLARREFAGYWEYLLDEALFVSPPHPEWGGSALLDMQGHLVGMGSLLVQAQVSGDQFDANMFIPIELLKPVLEQMLTTAGTGRPARPWLGLFATEQEGEVVVVGVAPTGPAAGAHLRRGDVITHVGMHEVGTLAQFYRTLWSQGSAGCEVILSVKRGSRRRDIHMQSASRAQFLHRPTAH